jgi:hypothetical protein
MVENLNVIMFSKWARKLKRQHFNLHPYGGLTLLDIPSILIKE